MKSENEINEAFYTEYTDSKYVRRYVGDTAGEGIAHILDRVYGPLYVEAVNTILKANITSNGFRILEYGCGGGMNLIWILRYLEAKGIDVDLGVGADFSPSMIEAAETEAAAHLSPAMAEKSRFLVAANESIQPDLDKAMTGEVGTFHLILGVNTFRYALRLKKAESTAQQLYDLLAPGGVSIMIDMNGRFPFFKSRLPNRLTMSEEQRYLPNLKEYAAPFREAGFTFDTEKCFCWVPHSAGKATVAVSSGLSPVLQTLFGGFAMRCLIVGRKPLDA